MGKHKKKKVISLRGFYNDTIRGNPRRWAKGDKALSKHEALARQSQPIKNDKT